MPWFKFQHWPFEWIWFVKCCQTQDTNARCFQVVEVTWPPPVAVSAPPTTPSPIIITQSAPGGCWWVAAAGSASCSLTWISRPAEAVTLTLWSCLMASDQSPGGHWVNSVEERRSALGPWSPGDTQWPSGVTSDNVIMSDRKCLCYKVPSGWQQHGQGLPASLLHHLRHRGDGSKRGHWESQLPPALSP